MTDTVGTPITRTGGYLVRVGWKAEAYSVDAKTESRFRLTRIFMMGLAIIVGVATALFGEWLLFDVVNPIIRSRFSFVTNHPNIWFFVIYGLTFMCGTLVYLMIMAKIGTSMVRGFEKRDDGLSFMEQRRRLAFTRKRDMIVHLLGLGLIFSPWNPFVAFPLPVLGKFVALVLIARIAEGLLFKFLLKKPAD